MNLSYAAETSLLRDERTKIEDSTNREPEFLPGNTPVWATLWLAFNGPYPTSRRVVEAKRDRVVIRYGVQRWTELKTKPKMYGFKVYRLRMTAAQYLKLHEANAGAHFEYAESGDR